MDKDPLIELNWNVGGGITHFECIMEFHYQTQRYLGIDENLISSVYDSHTGLLWNGGRYTQPLAFSLEESIRRVRAYNALGIGFRFTFSNCLITVEDLNDDDCNWLLHSCANELNAVIVASPILARHIRQHFPMYRLVASVGFARTDLAFYRQALAEYDLVVLSPDKNRDHELLRSLDVSRLEVLVNEHCVANCPYRQEHTEHISQIIRERRLYFRESDAHSSGACLASEHGYTRQDELILGFHELDYLFELGVRHFKIQGREHPFAHELEKALGRYVLQYQLNRICHRASRVTRIALGTP